MAFVYFITHADVLIDPAVPVPQWPLSSRGRSRMRAVLSKSWVSSLRSVWSSTEQKAIDGAHVIALAANLPHLCLETLGENDRSATGYLPKAKFEATADAFFAYPYESVAGWEKAIDAQRRIVGAITSVTARSPIDGDIAVVSHGAVGALLLCHLKGCRISRAEDQPATNGGNYFSLDAARFVLQHGWRPIDA